MEYLQYEKYIKDNMTYCTEVLNLIINGIPSIRNPPTIDSIPAPAF